MVYKPKLPYFERDLLFSILTKGDTNNLVSIYIETINDIKNLKKLIYIGLSTIDLSTGKSTIYETYSKPNDINYSLDETFRFIQIWNPKELIIYMNKTLF